jgi:hypothetical protein
MCIALIMLLSSSSQVFKEPDLQDSIDFSTNQILFNAGLPLYLEIQSSYYCFQKYACDFGTSELWQVIQNNASKSFAIS